MYKVKAILFSIILIVLVGCEGETKDTKPGTVNDKPCYKPLKADCNDIQGYGTKPDTGNGYTAPTNDYSSNTVTGVTTNFKRFFKNKDWLDGIYKFSSDGTNFELYTGYKTSKVARKAALGYIDNTPKLYGVIVATYKKYENPYEVNIIYRFGTYGNRKVVALFTKGDKFYTNNRKYYNESADKWFINGRSDTKVKVYKEFETAAEADSYCRYKHNNGFYYGFTKNTTTTYVYGSGNPVAVCTTF